MKIGQREAVATLCVAAIACYAYPLFDPSRTWEFISMWDDDVNFFRTNVYQSLAPSHLWQMLTLTLINVYEPLGWLLKAIVYAAAGLDSRAYRIVTLVLHLATAGVLTRLSATLITIAHAGTALARKTVPPSRQNESVPSSNQYLLGCALSTLLLFVIHPLNVEIVAWPSAQPYALSALLSVVSLYLHCRALERRLHPELLRQPHAARGASPETEMPTSELGWLAGLVTPSLADKDTQLAAVFFLAAVLSKSVCLLVPLAAVLIDMLVVLPVITTFQTRHGYYPSLPQAKPLLVSYVRAYLPLLSSSIAFLVVAMLANKQGSHEESDVITLSPSERVIKTVIAPVLAMRHLLWPSNLRPHYQVQDDELRLVANSECLLSALALAIVAFLLYYQRGELRFATRMAAAYYCTMLLPTSGLVQHGIVTMTADRYAYFPTMVLVPFGGYWLTHWLKLEDSTLPTTRMSTTVQDSDRPVASSKQARQSAETTPAIARVAYILLTLVMLTISRSQLALWETSTAFFAGGIERDPADASMYNYHWQYRLNYVPGGCSAGFESCENEISLAFYFSPRKSLKAKLLRSMLLYVLGQQDRACANYRALLTELPNHAMVLNNVGFCDLRDMNLEAARARFKAAQAAVAMRPIERETIANNYFATEEWAAKLAKASGEYVEYQAQLLW